jgi:LuxR family maltose regulon positive regulatory protein
VAGPAGSGKTVLLTEWIQGRPDLRVAWVSLDAMDNRPARFWKYVISSIQAHDRRVGVEALDLLLDAEPDDPASFIESLIADLSGLDSAVVLVLDDLHVIREPSVHQALERLIEQSPAGLQIVMSARSDPPLPLHRWRARGRLVEIRQSELRFDNEEADLFFRRFDGVRLSRADVELITERAEGWAAGMQLAALSLRGSQDPTAVADRFSGLEPGVADFLVGEVIASLPADVADFLMRTSVLEQFSAPLCDAITGRHDSLRLLHWLETQNLFLVRLDEPREWFRYHHLFAELLRAVLRTVDPGAADDVHRRAARWFIAEGWISHAINQLVSGHFYDEAIDLIVKSAARFYLEGQRLALGRFLDLLPDELFLHRPERMIDRAGVLAAVGRYAESVAWLRRAEWALADLDSPDRLQAARLAAVWATAGHLQGDAVTTVEHGTAAIELYSPEADDGECAILPYGLIRAWGWLMDTEAAWTALRSEYPVPPLAEPLSGIIPPATVSQIYFIEGRLRDASRLADEALAAGLRAELDHPILAEARLTRAGVLWERNLLGPSETEFELALRSAESNNRVPFLVLAALGLARIWQLTGRQDDAFDLLAVARQANGGRWLASPFATRVDAAEARMLIDADSLVEARRLLERLPGSVETALLASRLSLAEGGPVSPDLVELLASVRLTPRQELECRILDACTPSATAARSLSRAIQFAAHERYIRCFLDAGDAMKEALTRCRAGEDAPFIRELIAAFAEPARTRSFAPERLAAPLTPREEAVLAFLPGWLSNREIAAELYVSVNTLKTHLKSLYRKLDATSRHDAVVRSKMLGLL